MDGLPRNEIGWMVSWNRNFQVLGSISGPMYSYKPYKFIIVDIFVPNQTLELPQGFKIQYIIMKNTIKDDAKRLETTPQMYQITKNKLVFMPNTNM